MDWAAFIVGLLAFIGILINLWYTHKIDKKKMSAEVITTNRIEWIQKLRDNLSEYIKTVWEISNFSKNHDDDLAKSKLYNSQVFLLLNINGEKDELIKQVLELIEKRLIFLFSAREAKNQKAIDKVQESINAGLEYLKLISGIYLKCEWERVKLFIKNGEENSFDFDEEFDDYREKLKTKIILYFNAFNDFDEKLFLNK